MSLNIKDTENKIKLPKIPKSMPVFSVKKASLNDRKKAIEIITNECKLGKMKNTIKFGDSLHFICSNGVLQYYLPSGSIWARNTAVDESFKDEKRPWKTMKTIDEEEKENFKLVLPKSTEKELAKKTEALFTETNLLGRQAYFSDVFLEEISELNEKGKEISRFTGEATVRFLYKIKGTSVDGPGAKSYAYFYPGDNKPQLVGVFHTWREIADSRSVKMLQIEEVFDKILNKDREIKSYFKRQNDVQLTKVDLVYYSFPPFEDQEYIFPAFRVNGYVVPKRTKKAKKGFVFARYFHAVTPDEYAKAGLSDGFMVTRL